MLAKPLKFSSIFVTVAIIVGLLCPQVTAKIETQVAQAQPSKRYRDFIVLFGKVRNDVGYFYGFGPQYNLYLGSAGWNECPTGFTMIGRAFGPQGFWLCARNDIASSTFFVGNVVKGEFYYYELSLQDGTHFLGLNKVRWNHCRSGQSVALDIASNTDGLWVCMDSSK